MTKDRLLKDPKAMNELAAKLAKVPGLSKNDRSEKEPESSTLAYTFSELEESFSLFVDDLLPRLVNADSEDEASNLLHDIGEEFRHILYHINDTRYYNYLA